MPNYLELEPEELRRIARQHDDAAARVRKWGEIPRAWLNDFPRIYGTIADPVRKALEDYYRHRHAKAERQAARHEDTRDSLIEAARRMEEADQESAHSVAGAGDFGSGESPGAVPDRESIPAVDSSAPFGATSTASPPLTTAGAVGAGPVAPVGAHLRQAPAGISADPQRALRLPGSPAGWVTDNRDVPDRVTARGGTPPPALPVAASNSADTTPFASDAGKINGDGAAPSAPVSAGDRPAPVPAQRQLPAPVPSGPLTAVAARAAESRRGLPSLVAGDHAEDDLVLARTLLAATLAAVGDSEPSLEWAVMVLRTSVGPVVMLTTTEGRGWLPPGLFLPVEVAIPWKWAGGLGRGVQRIAAALEGITDPARMLAEFWRSYRPWHSRISALVSSAVIADNVREALGDGTAVAERVRPASAVVDFASPGAGLVDRLAMGGSDRLRQQADAVPVSEIWPTCLALAREADARVCAAISGHDEEVAAHRIRRQRVFESLASDRSLPPSWVDELYAHDALRAAAQRAQRIDISRIAFGAPREHAGASLMRNTAFERRADEMLFLLARKEPDRQMLRDVLYTYGQIVEHPLFPTAVARATGTSGIGLGDARVPVTGELGSGAAGAGTVVRDMTAPSGTGLLDRSAEPARKGSSDER